MKTVFYLIIITILVPAFMMILSDKQTDDQSEWMTLFNGKDFAGWYTYESTPEPTLEVAGIPRDEEGNYLEPIGLNKDPLDVFTIVEEDGEPAIRISGEVFSILVTEKEYENYHLKLQFKWGEERHPPRENQKRDSGILYHSIGPEGAWYGVWMKSFECQVQETDCGDFINVDSTFAMIPAKETDGEYYYDPNSDEMLFSAERSYANHSGNYEKPHGEWNTMEIYTAKGNSVHVVNGQVNMRAYRLQAFVDGQKVPLTKGKIQLQSEGAEIYYRNIQLQHIDEIPAELM